MEEISEPLKRRELRHAMAGAATQLLNVTRLSENIDPAIGEMAEQWAHTLDSRVALLDCRDVKWKPA